MRGRRPKPTAQRVLEGNPGHRPLNPEEPEFPPVDGDITPIELLDDKAAIEEWARLSPLLTTARVMTEADRGALLALCQQWSRYLAASAKVKDAGLVVKAPSGYPIPNPYLPIANRALSNCTKLWAELGLTPSSRSRVSVTAGVKWSGHSQVGRPQSKVAQLQAQAARLRRPLKVK